MSLPNLLTIARFGLAGAGIAALLAGSVTIAGIIFIVAAVTDYLDGFLARRWNQRSAFGAIMDPLADKVLVLPYVAHFTVHGAYAEWIFLAMLVRELLHDGLRGYAASRGTVIGANWPSKLKTVFQMLSLLGMLGAFAVPEWATAGGTPAAMVVVSEWLMVLALLLGWIGTALFVWCNAASLRPA